MRTIKLTLIILLAAVTALFGFAKISGALSDEDEGPSITCDGQALEISVHDGQEVLLAGVTAEDAQDGDLTGEIILSGVSQLITEDTAIVTYLVFDSDDNMAQLQRSLRYTDYRKPQLRVLEPLVFGTDNTSDLLSRLSAEDVIDGDISSRIRLSNLWATENTDLYSVTVLVTNSMGDTARLELPVIVQDELSGRPVINLKSHLIYLEQGEAFDAMEYLTSVTVRGEVQPLNQVEVENEVDTGVSGSYWVRYTYSADGIQGTAVLTVVVM